MNVIQSILCRYHVCEVGRVAVLVPIFQNIFNKIYYIGSIIIIDGHAVVIKILD